MGKTKYVVVNNHLAQIWDSTFEVFVAHVIEAAAATGKDLSGWEVHAFATGDSLQFTYLDRSDVGETTMIAILGAARDRIHAMGDVGVADVAAWSLGVNNRKVSGGALRGNLTVTVELLLEVTDWFEAAVRGVPNRDYGAELGVPERFPVIPDGELILDVVAGICDQHPYPEELCDVRMTKLVYLADRESMKHRGCAITTVAWGMISGSPWTPWVLDAAANCSDFQVEHVADGFGGTKKVISLVNTRRASGLSEDAQESVQTVIDRTKYMSFDELLAHVAAVADAD